MERDYPSFFDDQPIFILDHKSLAILDVNKAAIECYGYSRDEFLSMDVYDLGEKKKRVELIDGLSDKNKSVDKIWTQQTKNGETLYVQFTYHTFYHKGKPAKIAIAHDVSELVQKNEVRRTAFPKFITHESNFPLARIEWNADNKIKDWSEQAEELFGWREDEVIGWDNFLDELIVEDEIDQAKRNLKEAIANRKTHYSVEGKSVTKSGEIITCEWHNSLIYDENQNLHSVHSLVTDISERKESQNLFRTLSEKSLVGVFLIQDGRFKYVNPRFAEIFGYDQQEIIDEFHPEDLAHPDDRALIIANMKDRLNGNPEAEEEYEIKGVTKGGRVIDASLYGSKTMYRGKPAIVGTLVDITKDKEIFRKYRSSVETFQNLFDSISDAVYIQDSKGRFLEVNSGAVEMYGYDQSYFIGKKPQVLAAPGKVDMDEMKSFIQKALDGKTQSFEWWGKRKNGEVFPQEIVISKGSYFGEDAVITIARDISERYEAEEELRKNEEMFRQLFQNSPISIALLDKRQEIRQVNTAFSETFGYGTEEIRGLNIDQLIVPEHEKKEAREISNTIFEGKPAFHSGKRLRKDGSYVDVLIYGVPVTVNDKTVAIFGIYVDISERKQAEEKIKKSLKEKEVLLAEIHHRVKNNLAVITGLLELQVYNTSSKEASDVLENSQMRVNSIALIHEKLYQNKNLSEICFEQYLQDLTDAILTSMGTSQTDIEVTLNIDPVSLTVNQAIPCGLILNEIITNAFKHAYPEKGKGNITVNLNRRGDDIYLSVVDDGIGIPDEINLENPKSLGIKLIRTLSKQLSAEAEFSNENPGTKFALQFSLEN
ncbi:PAS domain-containing sensor histidine kinase [Fodinibius sp. AD559]|uniref:PAS domain-containing sensor histidine kinase n=1 Tax=Fodinibius sp. AD559 TaxID=3424179 RepID=UPI004046DDB2